MDPVAAEARETARQLLEDTLPMRWSHVRAVSAMAERVASALDESDRMPLVAAAWLHDIGYAPALVDTGFHPLDGARWLRRAGWPANVVGLVANHSYALVEAAERGLAGELAAEFPAEQSAVAEALAYCDLTTGPDGQRVDVVDRIAEIRSRYGRDSVVGRFVDRAEGDMIATVRRVEARLRAER
ncbi:MAG TPA: HD domain-containing protein [Micromonosporaceae bacterium]|nr:HD domain-containing protein [Micromonosporaceae bacterium]